MFGFTLRDIVLEFRLHDSTYVLANTVATLTLVDKKPK